MVGRAQAKGGLLTARIVPAHSCTIDLMAKLGTRAVLVTVFPVIGQDSFPRANQDSMNTRSCSGTTLRALGGVLHSQRQQLVDMRLPDMGGRCVTILAPSK
jgi:hypothetical protein